jgi:hypothetical protein
MSNGPQLSIFRKLTYSALLLLLVLGGLEAAARARAWIK